MLRRSPGIATALLAGLLTLAACGAVPPAAQAVPEAASPVAQGGASAQPAAASPIATPSASRAESTLPPAALAAQKALAGQIGVAAQDLTVVSVESVDWPDSCLGAEQPGEMCAAVITPGYRVILTAGGKSWEVHTNDDGSNFRVVEAPATRAGSAIIRWLGLDDTGACVAAEISAGETAWASCDASELTHNPLTFGGRPGDLEMLRTTYAPFSASTAAGDVVFAGTGRQTAVPSQQRMIAERARSAFLEARGGASAVGSGLALQLYQEGGIAAICQNVSVYLMGFAYVVDCSARPAQVLDAVMLDAAQLEQLYAWTDTLGNSESGYGVGGADAMTSTLSLFGAGAGQPSDADLQAMEAFALEIGASAKGQAVAAGCPVATSELQLYSSAAFGFCFLYPPTVAEATVSMTDTVFVAGGDLMNHGDARLSVEVVEGGGTPVAAADALVADNLAAIPGLTLDRSTVAMAGVEAAQIDRVPGQDFSRVLFLSNGDTLLKMSFTPSDPEMAGYAAMQALYTAVVNSFAFAK